MTDMVPQDDYHQIQQSLRPMLAARVQELFQALKPHVDGSFGEVDPRHAAVAVALIKELGRLYRVYDVPEQVQVGLTEEQVQVRITEAVAAARLEWEMERRAIGVSARDEVLKSLRSGEDLGGGAV